MSKYFKLVFLIRFIGYFTFLAGLSLFLIVVGPVIQAEGKYRFDQIIGVKHSLPTVISSTSDDNQQTATTSFGELSTDNTSLIVPISTGFGIVIEKINANANVVADVDPINEAAYTKALSKGVVHAAGTNYPGEKGNVYLFSHSTDAPWNIVRYNAVFYLLRELEAGDRVVLFYKDRRYDYLVYDKNIVSPTDISYLTNKYEQSVLTLQTCDPPGTLFKRLVVRAKLQGS